MGTGLIVGMSLVMIAIGVLFLYLIQKNRKKDQPRDQLEIIGTALSGLLVVSAVALLVMTTNSDSRSMSVEERPPVIEDITLEVAAENFSFVDYSDNPFSLEDFEGKVVLVNFWATWCIPCLTEIPDLNRLQKNYGENGFVVLSISDEETQLLVEFERRLPMLTTRMRLADPESLPFPFTGGLEVRPASFIIDRAGTVRRYLLGARSYGFFERAISPFL